MLPVIDMLQKDARMLKGLFLFPVNHVNELLCQLFFYSLT